MLTHDGCRDSPALTESGLCLFQVESLQVFLSTSGFHYVRKSAWHTVIAPLYSAGMCTVEGNNGTLAATGTTPHTVTTGCSHVCQAISQILYRAASTTQSAT